jgi:hypothetical protein
MIDSGDPVRFWRWEDDRPGEVSIYIPWEEVPMRFFEKYASLADLNLQLDLAGVERRPKKEPVQVSVTDVDVLRELETGLRRLNLPRGSRHRRS